MIKLFTFIILGYLIGSISGSLLLGKFKKVDIRNLGSGNAGATNAFRSIGPFFALGTLLIDIMKGYLPVILFSPYIDMSLDQDLIKILIGISCVLGHVYPIFYSFKGGKGAGTLLGVIAAIFPSSISLVFSIWILVLIFTGYVGLSTIFAGLALVVSTYFWYSPGIYSAFGFFTILISIFLIFTHRSNISRMIEGKENQFQKVMIFKNIFRN